MISQYKNIERLRYRISNDIYDATKGTDNVFVRIFRMVFSSIFSFYLSTASRTIFGIEEKLENVSYAWLWLLFILSLIFVLFFGISFKMSSYVIKAYNCIRRVGPRKSKLGMNDKRKATKDFDNIAIDSLLLVDEYIQEFSKNNNVIESDVKKQYYLFEIIHYMLTACRFATPLITLKCIDYDGNEESHNIEEYRFRNFLDIMKEQILFLDSKSNTDYFSNNIMLSSRVNEIKRKYNWLEDNGIE